MSAALGNYGFAVSHRADYPWQLDNDNRAKVSANGEPQSQDTLHCVAFRTCVYEDTMVQVAREGMTVCGSRGCDIQFLVSCPNHFFRHVYSLFSQ